MGLYGGGGSPPPPPPDYSAEKAKIIADTLAGYQAQANTYNASVSAANNTLNNLNTGLNTLTNQVKGVNINQIWDDPNTAANENVLAGYQNTLSGGLDTFNSLNVGSKPTFDSVIQSQYGPLTITNIPTLENYNQTLANSLQSGANSLQTSIDALNAQRSSAETQARNDYQNALNTYGSIGGSINDATIASDLGALSGSLTSAKTAYKNLGANPIVGQLYSDFGDVSNQLNTLTSTLNTLKSDKTAEQQRIADYEKSLYNSANQYYDTLGGLTIADESGINSLQSQIDALQRGASSFSSVLPYDLSQENNYVNSLEAELNKLQGQRTAELNRISQAETNFNNAGRSLNNTLAGASIYDKAYLDNLKAQAGDLQSQVGAFSSVLPYNFGGATDAASTALATLNNLYGQRSTALNDIRNSFGNVSDKLADIPLYNEAGIKAQRNPLTQAGNMLNLFTGNDVDPIRYQILQQSNAIDNKLNELYAYRDQLETNAKVLMQKVKNNTYYTLDDVTNAQAAGGDFASMQDEVDLYQAQQAMDEIQGMMEKLTQEKQRLEQDAANVAARDTTARGNLVIGSGGVPQFSNFSLIDPITMEQYINSYIYNNQNKDDVQYVNNASPSSFANALGVIQVGG